MKYIKLTKLTIHHEHCQLVELFIKKVFSYFNYEILTLIFPTLTYGLFLGEESILVKRHGRRYNVN